MAARLTALAAEVRFRLVQGKVLPSAAGFGTHESKKRTSAAEAVYIRIHFGTAEPVPFVQIQYHAKFVAVLTGPLNTSNLILFDRILLKTINKLHRQKPVSPLSSAVLRDSIRKIRISRTLFGSHLPPPPARLKPILKTGQSSAGTQAFFRELSSTASRTLIWRIPSSKVGYSTGAFLSATLL